MRNLRRHLRFAVRLHPGRKSITELEFRHAVEKGKRCLLFLLDENASWQVSRIEHGDGHERIKAFRQELSNDYTVSFFENCDELARKVATAVAGLNVVLGGGIQQESQKISIARLPVTGPDLFGRDAELKLLDDAWADPNTNVVAFVASGGVGKSALVNTWLARMAKEKYREAERVFAWSFYSQGTSDERAASADLFIDAALRWFGDEDSTKGSPWDKGERLANLIRRTRTLLVLDGLEPLQHPPGPEEGKLKDPALQALLRELAAQQRGLCVTSTRLKIRDLEGFARSTVKREDLDHLTPQAGAQILRAQRIEGDDAELEAAAAEFGGHSLALTLLGSYLADVCGGDIRRRREIGNLEEDERHGGHARRVMAAYEKWLGDGPELAVLRLLGLFDRPAPADAIAVLRAGPVIPGLTDALQNLSETKWRQTLAKLRRIKLLAEPSRNSQRAHDTEGELDAHPLLREHFGTQLKEQFPNAWREANGRLYEHLKCIVEKFPTTVEDILLLYTAAEHGCEASRHREVFDQVYQPRIMQKNYFAKRKLGLFGADLSLLMKFKELPALTGGHLCGLLMTKGDFQDAITVGEKAVDLADKSMKRSHIPAKLRRLVIERAK